MASTANYAWVKPTVDGDRGAWGTILNTALDDADVDVKAVSDAAVAAQATATAALPKAGGIATGGVDFLSLRPKVQQLGSISGAVAINLALGYEIRCTLAGSTTFSFTNVPSGSTYRTHIRMHIYNPSGAYTITWPTEIAWEATRLAPTGTTGFVTPNFNTGVEMYTDSAGSDYFGRWTAY